MNKDEFQIKYHTIIATPYFKSLDCKGQLDVITTFLKIYHAQLPEFPTNQYVSQNYLEDTLTFDSITYSAKSRYQYPSYEVAANPADCIGYVWLFQNDHSGGQPIPERLAPCLFLPPDNAPSIYASKIGNHWYCGDGCHRIYAAFLLDRTVRLIIDSEKCKLEL